MTLSSSEFMKKVEEGEFPSQTIVPLDDPFEDMRGSIQNLILSPMTSAAIITSEYGTVRANHMHKTDWHYAYVLSGRILYFERPVGSTDIPEPIVVDGGKLFFTPPNVEHAMLFLKKTTFVTFAKNVRTHENHEQDLVRVRFITPELAKHFMLKTYVGFYK